MCDRPPGLSLSSVRDPQLGRQFRNTLQPKLPGDRVRKSSASLHPKIPSAAFTAGAVRDGPNPCSRLLRPRSIFGISPSVKSAPRRKVSSGRQVDTRCQLCTTHLRRPHNHFAHSSPTLRRSSSDIPECFRISLRTESCRL